MLVELKSLLYTNSVDETELRRVMVRKRRRRKKKLREAISGGLERKSEFLGLGFCSSVERNA